MLFYIMGKSASGKDTLYEKLLLSDLGLKRLAIYTTRPKRDGEVDGIEYYFVNEKYLEDNKDKVIEKRVYNTVFGPWYYATLDDGKVNNNDNYLVIGTLESYNLIKKHYGEDNVKSIYLEVDKNILRDRALKRENMQKIPKIDEMERRLKADLIDFSEENIKKAGITKRYINDDFDKCYLEVYNDIKKIKND